VAAPLLDFRLSNAQTSLSAAFGSGSIGGPPVNGARPSELKNRRVMRRFYTATARPRPAGETPKRKFTKPIAFIEILIYIIGVLK